MQHNMFSYHLTRRRNIPLSIGTRNNARKVRIIQKSMERKKYTDRTREIFTNKCIEYCDLFHLFIDCKENIIKERSI